MGDPLSAVSALSAIVGLLDVATRFCSQVSSLARAWNEAPAQIRSLAEEIDLSHHITKELEAICKQLREQSQTSVYAEAISTRMKKARLVWAELEEIVQSVQGDLKQNSRRSKWIIKAHCVSTLQKQLQDIRTNIKHILDIYTASRNIYIESLVATCNRNTLDLYNISTTSFTEIKSRLEKIETSQSSASNHNTSLMQEYNPTSPTESQFPAIRESSIYITLGLKQRNSCSNRCYCRCHSRRDSRIRIAPFNSILGSLYLIYSGFALAGQQCDTPSCHNHGTCMIQLRYSVPQWILSISIIGCLRIVNGYPAAGLVVQRRITKNIQATSILDLARFGTAVELRSFIQKYPHTVYDIDARQGETALVYVLAHCSKPNNQQYENANLLLAFGADPFAIDDSGRYCALVELLTLFTQKHKVPFLQDICFSMADLENLNLSHLTKIILRLRPLPLDTEIAKIEFRRLINLKDNTGLTPLHWAVRIGDSLAVQQLLKAGADPNMLDPWGNTPLNSACMHLERASCIKVLMMAGTDLTHPNYVGLQPIHYAAGAGHSDETLSMLLNHGSNIQAYSSLYRESPLSRTAMADRDISCKFLLEHGAQVDSRDFAGSTPLSEAIRTRSHQVLVLLLSAGANYLNVDDFGTTTLHSIAIHGDNTTIAIISKVCLLGFDPEAKDRLGYSAYDYLQRKVGVTGFGEAFARLMERIKAAKYQHLESFESDDEERFVDALEDLSLDQEL